MDNPTTPQATFDDLAGLVKRAFELIEGMVEQLGGRIAELDRLERDAERRQSVNRDILLGIANRLGVEVEDVIDLD
jgi:hypothetical protein